MHLNCRKLIPENYNIERRSKVEYFFIIIFLGIKFYKFSKIAVKLMTYNQHFNKYYAPRYIIFQFIIEQLVCNYLTIIMFYK